MSVQQIQVNQSTASTHSTNYNQVTNYLKAHVLDPEDAKTTIEANNNSKAAFLAGQCMLESLAGFIDSEAQTIRKSGLTFKEYDDMLSGFIENGPRD